MAAIKVVTFDSTAESVFKAALLARLLNAIPIHRQAASELLFQSTAASADDFPLSDVQLDYLLHFGRDRFNYSQFDIEQLLKQISLALRYNAPDRFEVVLSFLDRFLDGGLNYVGNALSREAREFYRRIRSVRREIERAKGFIHFELISVEDGKETLYGRWDFKHDVSDIVIAFFIQRFPNRRIVLALPGGTLMAEDGMVKLGTSNRLPVDCSSRDDFARFWNAYYKVQGLSRDDDAI